MILKAGHRTVELAVSLFHKSPNKTELKERTKVIKAYKIEMLLQLDDDCLHVICDYLDLKDQLMLSTACKDMHDFIIDRLRRTCKKISFFTEFWRSKESEIYMPALLKATVDTVETIDLTGNTIMANRHWLEQLTFPKVTVLYISLRNLNYSLDEVLPIVAKLFPNATTIKTSGEKLDETIDMLAVLYPDMEKIKLYNACTGINVVKLKNLQKLYIHTGSERFDCRVFSHFLRAPQLKSLKYFRNYGFGQQINHLKNTENLQELTVHGLDFENFLQAYAFIQMKSLQKITVYEYPLFYKLLLDDKRFHRQIVGFSISRRYSPHLQLLLNAPKLCRLWINRDSDILPDFYNEAAKPLNKLEELYFIYSRAVEETQQNIMTVVSRSPMLRLLDISGSKFHIGFVESLISVLKWKRRTNEIILRCHKTEISSEDIRSLDLPENLKVSFERIDYKLPKRNTINFQIFLSDQMPDME